MPQILRLLLVAAAPCAVFAQDSPPAVSQNASTITLPAGTQLPVSIPGHLPMRSGQPLRATLLYPVYAGNRLILPAGTPVNGTVVALTPDHPVRARARLGLDFTPFVNPIVRFDSIVLANGTTVPISTGTVQNGAPIYRLVAPPPVKGGLFAHLYAQAKVAATDRIHVITGPDKADRATQFLFHQLPYHPQRIAKATAWTAETSAPVELPSPGPDARPAPLPADRDPDTTPTWLLNGYLTTPISSETSKPGQKISATVAEPILNPDGSIAVPQGSLLTGEVTQARPARKLSRAGELKFSFRQIQFPGHEAQSVRASLKGADSASEAQLAMDSEGQVKPKPQDKLAVPLILLALAARPLDQDGGRHHHQLGKDAVASNSLGLLGFILGTAAQRPNLAAGIGYYGAALSIYQRIFAKGKPVTFSQDTRVILQTTATRSAALKPDAR